MSASPNRKKPKLGSAARQWVEGATMSEAHPGNMESGPKAELKFKSEVDYAIWRAVCGKPSPWLIDPEFKPAGTFEDRFRAGDKQILLWEINFCAQSGRPIPKWATNALYDILYGMAKGGVVSWNDCFGKPYADGKQRRGMGTRAQMFDAHRAVKEVVAEKKNRNEKMDYEGIYADAGRRLEPCQSGPVVKKLYDDVEKAIKSGKWKPWDKRC